MTIRSKESVQTKPKQTKSPSARGVLDQWSAVVGRKHWQISYLDCSLCMLLAVLRRWSWSCSYSVWLCGLYYEALHVLKHCFALFPRVSSYLLALGSPRLGKRELVCVLLVHLFVLRVLVFVLLLFLLVSGVGCGLWLWHSLDFSITFLPAGYTASSKKPVMVLYTYYYYNYTISNN